MLNKVMLIGRLGRDPEVRYSGSGTAFCNFSIATTRSWKNQSGEKQEDTQWHNITAIGRTAEICGEYLHKGSLVYIEGRLQTREWDDKEGNKRKTTEVVVEQMKMLGGKNAEQPGGGKASQPDIPDDDVPF